tara:strand:+ start:888 stop:1331 length:444 start_codon:yes stop_codon:yes gene_type:complete
MAKSNIRDNIPKDGKINRQDLEELVDLFKNPHPLQASADSTVRSRQDSIAAAQNQKTWTDTTATKYDPIGAMSDKQKARLARQGRDREYRQNFAGRHGLSGGQQQELSQNGSVWVGNTQFVDLGGTLTPIKRRKPDGSMEIIHKGKN